jgi:ElaB/YqjD/DUF883 family membrane-anchored ribosome-binding protein
MHTSPFTGNGSDTLAGNLRHMVDEAERMLTSAAQSGDDKVDAVRQRLAEHVREMRVQLEELEEDAVHQARRAARRADHAVHEHPYGAMGVAAAVGLLVGFLAARR